MQTIEFGDKVFIISKGKIIETEVRDIQDAHIGPMEVRLCGVKFDGEIGLNCKLFIKQKEGLLYLQEEHIFKTQREADLYLQVCIWSRAFRRLKKDMGRDDIRVSYYLDVAREEVNNLE